MPLSRKLLYFILCVFIGGGIVLLIDINLSEGTPEIILPDSQLPWNSNHTEVVEVLNKIYQHGEKETEWALCDTGVPGLWQMCLSDQELAGPFKFNFVDDKLVGYYAEFSMSQYDNLVYSGKHIYTSRGFVKTASRHFRVYEMEIKHGWLELYMVMDKDLEKIRVQAKYKYIEDEVKPEKDTNNLEDEKAWEDTDTSMASATNTGTTGSESLLYLNILTFEPRSSRNTKDWVAPLRQVGFLVLAEALYGTSLRPLSMIK